MSDSEDSGTAQDSAQHPAAGATPSAGTIHVRWIGVVPGLAIGGTTGALVSLAFAPSGTPVGDCYGCSGNILGGGMEGAGFIAGWALAGAVAGAVLFVVLLTLIAGRATAPSRGDR